MNDLVTAGATPSSLALRDDELLPVLQSSLYPGAKPESIKLVLGYCRAAGLDPMQKPVHIVPMRVKKPGGGRDDYEWRDVVMPGVGLYRTQAARTGAYVGVSEPEFGPEREIKVGDHLTVYPEWCRVTVKRLMPGGFVAEFTAVEYWLENYATAGRDTRKPNEMWGRRPRGQIAKCAEAQALRKAFPEIGAQPTADEVDPDGFLIDGATGQPATTAPTSQFNVQRRPKPVDAEVVEPKAAASGGADQRTDSPAPTPAPKADPKPGDEALIGIGEVNFLKNKATSIGADLDKILADMGGLVLDKLTKADFATVKAELRKLEG